jgi:hypothetical protein
MLIDVAQGSGEWLDARLGIVTASRFADAILKKKDGSSSAKREDYKFELLAERLTKSAAFKYVNAEMQWGRDNEPAARADYAFSTEFEVLETGLWVLDDNPSIGASPDGFVGEDGLIEIKCPSTKNHLLMLVNGVNPDYLPQIYGQQWVTGRAWTDFISYDARLPEPYRIYIERIPRDEKRIKEIADGVIEFANELEELQTTLARGKAK